MVHKIELSPNAASADVHILVPALRALVRKGSAFWNVSGVNLQGKILKGIEVDLESLRTLFTGAIEFATPTNAARQARYGLLLHNEPKDEWLAWAPNIPLGAPQEKPAPEAGAGATKAPAN